MTYVETTGRAPAMPGFPQPRETTMWKCIRCTVEIPYKDVDPGIDSFGIYFICPRSERRNNLINVGKGNLIELAQTSD
ncbi:hypothetical protein [Paraburkholderia sediminicola]|uniref:hypothetical protein n=1 Tax=Paraburkholderia sediminicola TaxID=458836 RepID=UPI0038BE19DC